jgi:hypothetical protein
MEVIMLIVATIFATFLLSLSPVLAADSVPVLNVKPTCEAGQVAAVTPGREHLENCLRSEEAARGQVKTGWSSYPAADKRDCVETATIGPASYVDLLTCLEIRQETRKPQTTSAETSGAATNLRRRQPTPASLSNDGP